MNLFWKKIFGGLTSTAKYEAQQAKLRNEYEQHHKELDKNPDIKQQVVAQPKRFDAIRNQRPTFIEDFNGKSRWSFGYHYKSDALLKNHSFTNEQQANNAGYNITVNQGILQISTKEESASAIAWDEKKGFIRKEYQFTSGVMQTGESFRQQYGVFQAKIRCSGKINHAFWLGADEKLPLIKVFHFDGKTIKFGNLDKNGKNESTVTGINPKDFYIYTLVWTEKELRWFVNNLEVARAATHIPKETMYLAFNSFISELQQPDEGSLEVDWVRVYSN